MSIEEDRSVLVATVDLQTAERIARMAIIRHSYQEGVDNDFIAKALAKQRNLGFGQEYQKMHAEAERAGLFAADGQPRTGRQGEIVGADEWNSTWFYLASDLLDPSIDGAVTEPVDVEDQLYQDLEKNGIDVAEVAYVEAENWNDGKFNFGSKPEKNPGVYRVWVRVGRQLGQMVEQLTESQTQKIR
jgi:hypothetical protein